MKKALVWKEADQGRVIGQIERIGEASEIDGWNHHLKAKMEVVELAVELESIDQSQLKTILVAEIVGIEGVSEFWSKDGATVYIDPLDDTWTHTPEVIEVVGIPEHYIIEKNMDVERNNKLSKIRQLREVLYQEVKIELNKIADNDPSAIATIADWGAYRIALRNITSSYKDVNGDGNSSLDNISDMNLVFPVKPS